MTATAQIDGIAEVLIHHDHELQIILKTHLSQRLENRYSSDFEKTIRLGCYKLLCSRLSCISRYNLDYTGIILGTLFQEGKDVSQYPPA